MKYGYFQEYLTKGRALKNFIEKKSYYVTKLVETDKVDWNVY